MSDELFVLVRLHATPPEHVDDVAALLAEHCLLPESGLSDDSEGMRTEVVLTVGGAHLAIFSDDMGDGDFVDKLAAKLHDLGVTAYVSQDGTGEYPGECAWLLPDLPGPVYGYHSAGEAALPASAVDGLLVEADTEVWDHLTWRNRLAAVCHWEARRRLAALDAEAEARTAAA